MKQKVSAALFCLLLVLLVSLTAKPFLKSIKKEEKGMGAVPYGEKLKSQFCKDNRTKTEISYLDALQIAQNTNCGLPKETNIAYTTIYKCNEESGIFQVDLAAPVGSNSKPTCRVFLDRKYAAYSPGCEDIIN